MTDGEAPSLAQSYLVQQVHWSFKITSILDMLLHLIKLSIMFVEKIIIIGPKQPHCTN